MSLSNRIIRNTLALCMPRIFSDLREDDMSSKLTKISINNSQMSRHNRNNVGFDDINSDESGPLEIDTDNDSSIENKKIDGGYEYVVSNEDDNKDIIAGLLATDENSMIREPFILYNGNHFTLLEFCIITREYGYGDAILRSVTNIKTNQENDSSKLVHLLCINTLSSASPKEVEMLNVLIKRGEDFDRISKFDQRMTGLEGKTPLFLLSEIFSYEGSNKHMIAKMINILVKKGANVDFEFQDMTCGHLIRIGLLDREFYGDIKLPRQLIIPPIYKEKITLSIPINKRLDNTCQLSKYITNFHEDIKNDVKSGHIKTIFIGGREFKYENIKKLNIKEIEENIYVHPKTVLMM